MRLCAVREPRKYVTCVDVYATNKSAATNGDGYSTAVVQTLDQLPLGSSSGGVRSSPRAVSRSSYAPHS